MQSHQNPLGNTLFQLSEDIYTYLIKLAPLLLCLGLVLSLIQKTVRFAYYRVDHLYLMEIRTEEVLQGLSYLFVFAYTFFLSHDIHMAYKKYRKIYTKTLLANIFFIIVYMLFLWYTQTYYLNILQTIVIVVFIIFIGIFFIFIKALYQKPIESMLVRTTVCTSLFIIIFAVIILQYMAEASNKRFTYIQNNNHDYIVVTTFKDYYITKLSKIENDTISVYRDKTYLFKLDKAIIAHEFKIKNMQ